MAERLVSKNLTFSTADAENPEVFFFNGTTLWLKFTDWQGQVFRVEFSEVVAFSWNQEEVDHKELSDDRIYEVQDSNWLKKHKELGTVGNIENYQHYKFCFNEDGILDVLFEEMKVIDDDK